MKNEIIGRIVISLILAAAAWYMWPLLSAMFNYLTGLNEAINIINEGE